MFFLKKILKMKKRGDLGFDNQEFMRRVLSGECQMLGKVAVLLGWVIWGY